MRNLYQERPTESAIRPCTSVNPTQPGICVLYVLSMSVISVVHNYYYLLSVIHKICCPCLLYYCMCCPCLLYCRMCCPCLLYCCMCCPCLLYCCMCRPCLLYCCMCRPCLLYCCMCCPCLLYCYMCCPCLLYCCVVCIHVSCNHPFAMEGPQPWGGGTFLEGENSTLSMKCCMHWHGWKFVCCYNRLCSTH